MTSNILCHIHHNCRAACLALLIGTASATVQAQNYDDLIQQAIVERNAGQLTAAEQTLRQAYPIPQDKTEVAGLLAMVLAFQARYDEAIEVLDEALVAAPADTGLLLGKARVRSFQGLHPEAMRRVNEVLLQEADNTEALNLAGRVSLYQQRPAQAAQYFERVLQLNAQDLEAWVGLYDARLAQGQNAAAETALASATEISPDHIDIRIRTERSAAPPGPANEWLAGFDNSRFRDIEFDDWQDRFLEYRRQRNLRSSYYLRAESNSRFGSRDTIMEAGWLGNRLGALPWQLSVAVSPGADFSANYRVRGAVTRRLNEGSARVGSTLMTPSVQVADYDTGRVWRLALDMEHYVANTNIWLTPALGVVRDEDGDNSTSWSLGAHWQPLANVRLGASVAEGAETENQRTTETRSRNAYLLWQVTPVIALRFNAGRYDRRNSYSRENYGVSVAYRY